MSLITFYFLNKIFNASNNLVRVVKILGFPDSSVVNNQPDSSGNAGDPGSICGSRKFPWRRKLQCIPVFLPGEYHGWKSLEGYSP